MYEYQQNTLGANPIKKHNTKNQVCCWHIVHREQQIHSQMKIKDDTPLAIIALRKIDSQPDYYRDWWDESLQRQTLELYLSFACSGIHTSIEVQTVVLVYHKRSMCKY